MPDFKLSCYALVRNARGQVLALQRATTARHFAGTWELPGGKPNPGEEAADAARREVREETGLEVQLTSVAGAVDFELAERRIIMLVFEATAVAGEVRLSAEHQAWRWARLEEFGSAGMALSQPLERFLTRYLASGEARHAG